MDVSERGSPGLEASLTDVRGMTSLSRSAERE
jgi:hypothetical protein